MQFPWHCVRTFLLGWGRHAILFVLAWYSATMRLIWRKESGIFFLCLVGMCVQNFTKIARCVHDLSYFVQNWAILQTAKGNLSQSGCNMENQAILCWWHYCRDTVYRFAWILDKICMSSVQKVVLWKPASWWRYNRAMWKMWLHINDKTVEILCTKLSDFWLKSVGVLSKNIYWKIRPHGGARRSACEKCWVEVLNC